MNADTVIAKVREIVAANPEFVYTSPEGTYSGPDGETFNETCKYLDPDTGKGSCVFGQALVELGADTEAIRYNEGASAPKMLMSLGVLVPAKEGDWMRTVQRNQDERVPWGEAVKAADFRYPLA